MTTQTCLECWRDASDSGAQGRCGCDCGLNCKRPATMPAVIVRGNSDGSRCDVGTTDDPWTWIDDIKDLGTAALIGAVVCGGMAVIAGALVGMWFKG